MIRDILDTKSGERRKEMEKAEREGKKVKFEEEEKAESIEELIYKRRIDEKLNVSNTSFLSDA